jgi:hypothetical protein
MTITEAQRRTLDLMAESAGWRWADVEAMAYDLFREPVAGLTEAEAKRLMGEIAFWTKEATDAGA